MKPGYEKESPNILLFWGSRGNFTLHNMKSDRKSYSQASMGLPGYVGVISKYSWKL